MGGGYKKFSLTSDGVVQGVHEVSFQLKTSNDADDGNIAYMWSESINVFPGMTTDTWLSSESDENGARKIDKKRIFSTFYVVGGSPSSDWFKTNPPQPDGTRDGSLSHPYTNIQDAIDRVIAINDGSTPFTIAVDGTVAQGEAPAGKGMADFSNLGKPLALTIRAVSESADGRATLDAKGMSCVVYASPASASGGTLNLTLKKLVITGGKSEANGGGIYLAQSAALTMANCEITGCHSSTYGGGVYTAGNLMMTDCVISGNTATTAGGGVYVSSSGTFTMNGGTIDGNTANYGGGVCADRSFEMKGGEISGNKATNSGGGVYVNSNGTLSMSDGAIISGNTSTNNAGGIWTNGTVTVTDCAISGNETAADGGGVYVNGSGTFTMKGGTVSGNTANSTSNGGGGIYVFAGGTLTITGNTTISNNTSKFSGGGIHVSGIVTATNCAISGNEATLNGGGVYVASGGTFTMKGGTVSGNTANGTSNGGGGIYVVDGGTLSMNNGATISGNASKYNGGGIYFNSSNDAKTLTLADGITISGNTASNSGGGVYAYRAASASTVLIMEGGTISSNTANYGGGVCASCSFEMTGGEILNNGEIEGNDIKTSEGGGVYANRAFTMNGDAKISGNEATIRGGGVRVVSGGAFTMDGNATISGNKVSGSGSHGGGVYNSGTFTMDGNATISGNNASGGTSPSYGGGVYTNDIFTMDGSAKISGNTASGKGGGVYVYNNRTVKMSGEAKVAEDNDVYLSASSSNAAKVQVDGELTATPPVAIITPGSYEDGRQVLSAGLGVTAITQGICDQFALTSDLDGGDWAIAPDGTGAYGVLKITSFYVQGSGMTYTPTATASDSNPGTKTKPFATVQKAVDTVIAGNDGSSEYTIYVDGTLSATSSTTLADFAAVSSLGKALKIKIAGVDGQKATLDGNNVARIIYAGTDTAAINIDLTLENLKIWRASNSGGRGGGITLYTTSANSHTIRNCEIYQCEANYGSAIYNEGGRMHLENCKIHDNTTDSSGIVYNGQSSAILTMSNVSFENNTTYNGVIFVGNGATVKVSDASAVIRNNTFTPASGARGTGICVWNGIADLSGSAKLDDGIGLYYENSSHVRYVLVSGALSESPVATITPMTSLYTTGTEVLVADAGVTITQDVCDRFVIAPEADGKEWKIAPNADGSKGVLQPK